MNMVTPERQKVYEYSTAKRPKRKRPGCQWRVEVGLRLSRNYLSTLCLNLSSRAKTKKIRAKRSN